MTYKLFPSLTDIGGSLIEAYQRVSRATPEAKTNVGKGENEEVKAQIGIASVEEYVTMSVSQVSKNEMAVFDLSRFDQPMRLVSLYIDDPNYDSIKIELFGEGNVRILRQNFGRNKTPIEFPIAPLPPTVQIKITALRDIDFVQIVLIPVVILGHHEGRKEPLPDATR